MKYSSLTQNNMNNMNCVYDKKLQEKIDIINLNLVLAYFNDTALTYEFKYRGESKAFHSVYVDIVYALDAVIFRLIYDQFISFRIVHADIELSIFTSCSSSGCYCGYIEYLNNKIKHRFTIDTEIFY